VRRRKRAPVSEPASRYLEAAGTLNVRFQEVDSLRIVWHGHYLTYFEEGRNAFGRQYEFGYPDIMSAGYVVPLVHAEVDYFAPARFEDELTVIARLHPERAARVTFTYLILGPTGRKLASGLTTQCFTDLEGNLVLTRPAFYEGFLAAWDAHMVELE